MIRPTRNQRIARLVAARMPLERRHARLAVSERGSVRHEVWGVCDCATAKRLRNIAVALAGLNTPNAALRGTNREDHPKGGHEAANGGREGA